MTRHILGGRSQIERDCRRLQAITLKEHGLAHRWIEALGAKREGLLRSYGRGGEDFWVYAWVRNGQRQEVAELPPLEPVSAAIGATHG